MLLVTLFLPFLHAASAQTSRPTYGVKVAVLPFEVFSIEKEPALGAEVADLITKQLALNPSILCIDSRDIKTVLQADGQKAMTEAHLRQTAKLLNANYIVIGTVTKIRDEHSIDVEVLSANLTDTNFKTYAEGFEIKSIVETVTTALDQEIMEKSDWIPTAQRPEVTSGREPSPNTPEDGFDVERELIAAYGPMEKKPSQQADAAAAPEEKNTQATPSLTEEPILDATRDAEPPVPHPSAPLPDISAPPEKEEIQPEQKKTIKDKIDSDFFTLSKAINIKSDSMEYDNRANKAIFKGNVVARQDDITMFANTMHVYYEEEGRLSKVDAQGDVRVVQGDRVATGDRIIFNNASKTIVATGNPRVWQGDNVVHGGKITVYLNEERTIVEGAADGRASATIYPDSDTKKP